MREFPAPIRAWLRGSLSQRYSTVLNEEIPQEMLVMLNKVQTKD